MIRFTIFRDRFSRVLTRQESPWHKIAHDFRHHAPEFISKQDCPLISLTEYGDNLSLNGSYRHIENVIRVHGIEGDYDAGEVSPWACYQRMIDLSLKALIVTTPSHVPAAPRWRILMPLARPHPIEARRELVERLNGALDGILAPESGTATQCFYVGKVSRTAIHYETHESFGRCIDDAVEIESHKLSIVERPAGEYQTTDQWKQLSRDEQYDHVRAAFTNKDGRHEAARRLSVMMAQDGASVEDIRAELIALIGSDTRGGEKGQRNLLRDIGTFPEWAVRKIGAPKADSMARADATLLNLLKPKETK
jgi:hypothetical protein